VAVQSPETTQGRDARSTVAEMESQETAGSTGVNSYVACLMLARLRHAAMSVLRSLSGEYRTWRGQRVSVEIDPFQTSASIPIL